MKIKHWGHGLRGLLATIVCLPIAGFAVVAWFGFNIIAGFVEVAKKSIVELPAERGVEVANALAKVHDRSEVLMLVVPVVCALATALVSGALLSQFFARLTSKGVQLLGSQQHVSKLTDKFTQTTEKIEMCSQQSSTAVDQSVAHLEMISSALHKMAVGVTEAEKNARHAVADSEKSEVELNHVLQALGGLVKQSKKLEEIINVIESIAFQTNILAVNAAVEAARAGEQGRGFAIVAEAVRNLAQTSAASAKNISVMIRESGETSKRAIESIRSGTEGLTQTLNQIRRSQEKIGGVVSVNAELADSLSKMSQALNQLESATQFMVTAADDSRQARADFSRFMDEFQQASGGLSGTLLSVDVAGEDLVSLLSEKAPTVEPNSSAMDARSGDRQSSSNKTHAAGKTSARPTSTHNSELSRRVNAKMSNTPATPASSTRGSNSSGTRGGANVRAKDLIPFEGESESETSGDVKIGSISGF